MRLLHTSDWHLGRSFHREDLLAAQAGFVDFLVETVHAERVDAVLVSGDVYDRALPSVDAVALCNDALRRLAATGVRVVLISGNHDSAQRLGFGSDLIDAAGIHLRTDPARCGQPVLLADEDGAVAVYALPYLEPAAVHDRLGCAERSHEAVLDTAMASVRADLRTRRARSVVLAHAFVTGGQPSDSERDISVGGVGSVPAGVFAGVDYAALGHLHGAQAVGERVRYSGSPLPYSFSEEHHRKAVLLVDLGAEAGAPVRVEPLPTPVPRRVRRLTGRLDQLLTDPSLEEVTGDYLQVTLTDAVRPREPMERLRRRFPHVLVLGFAPEGSIGESATSYSARLRGRSDHEVAGDFVAHVRSPASERESALLAEAFEAVRLAEVGA